MFYTFIMYCKTCYIVIALMSVKMMVNLVVFKWFVVVYKRSLLCIEMCCIQIKD